MQREHAPLGPLSLLAGVPRFRALFLAQAVSELGDWFQIVALLSLLPTAGGKAHVAAWYFVLRLIPSIVWAPLAGLVADRVPRGRVLVACDLARAGLVLCYLLVVRADGTVNVPLLYVLSFLQESVSAFFEPARGAVIPQIVPPRGLLSANAISGATWSAMLALGAALGGVVTRTLGRDTAFVLDAVTFLVSALLVVMARLPGLPEKEAAVEGAQPRLFDFGIDYLRSHRPQLAAACVKGGWGLLGGITVLYAAFAHQVFGGGSAATAASALGILYAGRGVGALAGPFVARRMAGESVRGLSRAILVSFPLAAIGMLGFGMAGSVWMGALALVVSHCGGSTVWVHSTQLLQLTVPNRVLGRVFALEWGLLTATMAASTLAVSFALDRLAWAPRNVAFAMAVVPLLSAAAWGIVRPRIVPRLTADAARPRPPGPPHAAEDGA